MEAMAEFGGFSIFDFRSKLIDHREKLGFADPSNIGKQVSDHGKGEDDAKILR